MCEGECNKCGYHHSDQDRCPAKGKLCAKCKKYNRFARLCKSVHALHVTDKYANTYAHDEINVDSCSSDEFVIDNISAFSNVSEITCSNY